LGEDAESVPDAPVEFVSPIETKVEDALEALQPADRAVLTLFYWDDLSLQEIGESLGCSANAAKTRLFRARERFKEAYEEAAS
jgi:RNA polymerase sigma-70 factor (ECF subfamily)